MAEVVAAGEFFFDLIFHRLPRLPRLGEELKTDNFALALGGGAPTTALALARMGRKVNLASVIGDTALDAHALAELKRGGVGTRSVKRHKRSMGAITVAVSLRRDRYFLTYNGANVFLERHLLSPAMRQRLGRARHVHFALSPLSWEPYTRLLRWLRRRGVTTSWDLGWNPKTARQPGFRRVCALLDVVFFNRDEALRYSGASTPAVALSQLRQKEQSVVIKLGATGATAAGPDGRPVRIKGLKVRAVDTTGAGDAFNAGFLHAWVDGGNLADSLRAGNVCGAYSTRFPGGSAGCPTRRELNQELRRMR